MSHIESMSHNTISYWRERRHYLAFTRVDLTSHDTDWVWTAFSLKIKQNVSRLYRLPSKIPLSSPPLSVSRVHVVYLYTLTFHTSCRGEDFPLCPCCIGFMLSIIFPSDSPQNVTLFEVNLNSASEQPSRQIQDQLISCWVVKCDLLLSRNRRDRCCGITWSPNRRVAEDCSPRTGVKPDTGPPRYMSPPIEHCNRSQISANR